MSAGSTSTASSLNTTHRVVIPFYIYAAISFLACTLLLVFSTPAFLQHHFHPHTMAITHGMALGWGTMIILGASHQLVPVLTETKLYSNTLAFVSFAFAALGIPVLVYAFYVFNIGWPARWGGILVNAAIVVYLANITLTISKSKKENVQAVFVFTAACWLLLTTGAGLILVYNFSYLFLPRESLYYLAMHAHMGIAGWFLLMVVGVGSRLIPMFLISKYENARLLWWVFGCINTGLLIFVLSFIYFPVGNYVVPLVLVAGALVIFGIYIFRCYCQRIRRRVDNPMKVSLLSVAMLLLPVLALVAAITLSRVSGSYSKIVMAYGFTIFFGWVTAIIFGMTFKTLPFIAWNKIYNEGSGRENTPDPKDLFSAKVFGAMTVMYITGFILFMGGILFHCERALKLAAIILLVTAVLYNLNVFRIVTHKPRLQ